MDIRAALREAMATLRKAASGPVLSAFAGIVMMGWIAGEILLLHANVGFTPLWPFYFLVGLAMTLLGLRAMSQGVRSLGHRMHHA